MPRQPTAWKSYSRLMGVLAGQIGQVLNVTPGGDQAAEEALLQSFSEQLRKNDPDALAILGRLNVSLTYYRQHLRYFGTWDVDRRRLLAGGAALRLLEDHAAEGKAGKLQGLLLSGDGTHQRQQLGQHLLRHHEPARPASSAPGWLEPALNAPVKPISAPRSIWVFPSGELAEPDMLHPMVVRSLIARYLPKAGGVVVDPMAGTGMVAREASRLGHRAWASDLVPGSPFVAKHDLARQDLSETLKDGAADLLVLHPPLKRQVDVKLDSFEAQIGTFIDNSSLCVKSDGIVALVVSSEDAAGSLQSVTTLLVASVNRERQGRVNQHGLTAHHLAVARNGSQAWHILIARFSEVE